MGERRSSPDLPTTRRTPRGARIEACRRPRGQAPATAARHARIAAVARSRQARESRRVVLAVPLSPWYLTENSPRIADPARAEPVRQFPSEIVVAACPSEYRRRPTTPITDAPHGLTGKRLPRAQPVGQATLEAHRPRTGVAHRPPVGTLRLEAPTGVEARADTLGIARSSSTIDREGTAAIDRVVVARNRDPSSCRARSQSAR